jgi:hypothetical protein
VVGACYACRIVQRCRQLKTDPSVAESVPREAVMRKANLYGADWKLHQLLEPERRRQRAGMVRAMQRVVQICWSGQRSVPKPNREGYDANSSVSHSSPAASPPVWPVQATQRGFLSAIAACRKALRNRSDFTTRASLSAQV